MECKYEKYVTCRARSTTSERSQSQSGERFINIKHNLISYNTVASPKEVRHLASESYFHNYNLRQCVIQSTSVTNSVYTSLRDVINSDEVRDVINSDEVQNKMISLFADETSSCDVNRLVDYFTEILSDSCHKVLSIKKQNKLNKNKQKQSQKWYNNNCYVLKKNLRNLCNLLAIYPNDTFLHSCIIDISTYHISQFF